MLVEQFTRLDGYLAEHRQFWQIRPFETSHRDWPAGLIDCIDNLNIEQVWQLDRSEEQLAALFQPWLPVGQDLLALSKQIQCLPIKNALLNERMGVGIAGRKWQQIKAFVDHMPKPRGKVLEWCAGKGHLGRVTSKVQACEVLSLEWDRALCYQGELLAQKHKSDQTFICTDVMLDGTGVHVPHEGMSIALHACGDLHVQLLKTWVARKGAQLMLAPCCYHLSKDQRYQPLSHAAGLSHIQLTKSDLSLPLQSTVTGGIRAQRLRDQEAVWRLSFDVLQRSVRGVNEYLPLPNIKKALLSGNFVDFLTWAAATKGLALPAVLDADAYLTLGQARLLEVRRTELVAKLFRRALEIWLVLDRALYLEEQGARVEVFNFCDYQLTPRNFMIRASRGGQVQNEW